MSPVSSSLLSGARVDRGRCFAFAPGGGPAPLVATTLLVASSVALGSTGSAVPSSSIEVLIERLGSIATVEGGIGDPLFKGCVNCDKTCQSPSVVRVQSRQPPQGLGYIEGALRGSSGTLFHRARGQGSRSTLRGQAENKQLLTRRASQPELALGHASVPREKLKELARDAPTKTGCTQRELAGSCNSRSATKQPAAPHHIEHRLAHLAPRQGGCVRYFGTRANLFDLRRCSATQISRRLRPSRARGCMTAGFKLVVALAASVRCPTDKTSL